jgi:glycosyltransferase involved in cell wall biosynthesis
LNILHVIPTFDPATGGPPRIAIRLAAGAASLGNSVTVLSYDTPHANQAIRDDHAQVPGSGLLTHQLLPQASRVERLLATGARRELKKILPRFDVVHTHDAWSALSRSAMGLAKKMNVPFVLLPNGMFDPWSLQQKRFKKNLVLASGYRRLLNHALFIHTGNVDEKTGVEQVGITAPIEIIPNGIYPAEFDPLPPKGKFYAAHPELKNRPYILFLSRLHFKKGLDYLADAFAKLAPMHPDVQLVVAGPDDGAEESFRQAIQAAGLVDRVHLVGPIFGADRFTALTDAVCFCLPSRQEGFSIAILEAMACARPVVITSACHFPEVATSGSGEVSPLNADALRDALHRILFDPAGAEAMGKNGRDLVMSHYTWPAIAAQLVATYQRHLSTATNLRAQKNELIDNRV